MCVCVCVCVCVFVSKTIKATLCIYATETDKTQNIIFLYTTIDRKIDRWTDRQTDRHTDR